MGGSSNNSGSSGGNDGGNDKPAKKKKATPKKNNGTSKYFKSTSTPKATVSSNGGRAGGGGVGSAAAKVADRRAKEIATVAETARNTRLSDNRIQRANLPSEVAKQYAQPASTRPATPIASTSKSYAAPQAKITTSPMSISASENAQIDAAKNGLVGPASTNNVLAINNTAQFTTSQDPKLLGEMGIVEQPKKNAQFKTSQDPKLLNEMGITKQARPQFGPLEQGVIPLAGTVAEAQAGQLEILQNLQANPLVRPNFNKDSYDQEALVGKDSLIRGDKYRNDEVSYNQAYYKARRAGGATQAELAAEQKSIGSKKMYSGDRVISEADQDRAKYTLQSLRRSGIDPTVTSEKSGFFDEMTTTKSSYDIGTGKSVTSTTQDYKPNILGVQLGDNITKTFVNGVATYTKTGDGERTTSELGSLKQRSQSSPDPIAEMQDIDNQIKTETDPVILKALHKRRLMLMRMNRTNTRFAGLLGEADTKRTNLMSIS